MGHNLFRLFWCVEFWEEWLTFADLVSGREICGEKLLEGFSFCFYA